MIIAAIYVPYVARPLRGQVLVLRNKEFIQAAVGSGAPDLRIMRREVLPNVLPTAIVFLPLMTALAMLTESALSFLSVGVQPPDASWGTIIEDGLGLLYTRPAVTIAPGLLHRADHGRAQRPRRRGARRARPERPAARRGVTDARLRRSSASPPPCW